jgi:hypothetical protein
MLGKNHISIDDEPEVICSWLEGDGGRERIFVFACPTVKSARVLGKAVSAEKKGRLLWPIQDEGNSSSVPLC